MFVDDGDDDDLGDDDEEEIKAERVGRNNW